MKAVAITAVSLAAMLAIVGLLWGMKALILAPVPVPVIAVGGLVAAILFVTTAVVTAKVIDAILKPPTQ